MIVFRVRQPYGEITADRVVPDYDRGIALVSDLDRTLVRTVTARD